MKHLELAAAIRRGCKKVDDTKNYWIDAPTCTACALGTAAIGTGHQLVNLSMRKLYPYLLSMYPDLTVKILDEISEQHRKGLAREEIARQLEEGSFDAK